jgi:hypothetical protein
LHKNRRSLEELLEKDFLINSLNFDLERVFRELLEMLLGFEKKLGRGNPISKESGSWRSRVIQLQTSI